MQIIKTEQNYIEYRNGIWWPLSREKEGERDRDRDVWVPNYG